MEQSTLNLLGSYMPMAQRYKSQFSSLNTLLSKTTLTGKISSLDIAENLFDYMEQTQEKFEELQEKLIKTIMEQNFLNVYEEAQTSSKVLSELLNAYLQSRYEEILALLRSDVLENCIDNQEEKTKEVQQAIFDYLKEFAKNSGAYKDVLLFDDKGNTLEALLPKVAPKTALAAILEAHKIESFGDFFSKVDFYQQGTLLEERMEFFFVLPLRKEAEQPANFVAVFVLDFQGIFEWLNNCFPYRLVQSNLVITNQKNVVLFSDNPKNFPVGSSLKTNTLEGYHFIEFRSKTCIFAQNEIGSLQTKNIVENWKVCRILPLYVAFDIKKQNNEKINPDILKDSLLITDELDAVIAEGENINEELGDAVINGEIIASKSHSYTLNPILNNIRILSEEMNTLCIQSAEELQKGIYGALFNTIGYYSKYAVVAMDNFLRECVCEISWIKNAPEFRRYLLEGIQDKTSSNTKEKIKSLLECLGENLKNYYNIVFFDKDGNILHNSLEDAKYDNEKLNIIERLGNSVHNNGVMISNYEASPLYDGDSTMIVYAGIKEGVRVIGGLAFVLDIKRVSSLINDIMPKGSPIISDKSEIFTVVFDSQKNILATTNPEFTFEGYQLEDKIDFKNLKDFKKIIKIDQKYYLLCTEVCPNTKNGFVEYTKHSLYSLVLVALKEEMLEC